MERKRQEQQLQQQANAAREESKEMPIAQAVPVPSEAKDQAPTSNPHSTGQGQSAQPKPASKIPFNMADLNLNDSNIKSFIMEPCPRKAGAVQCYIKRNKSGLNKLFPEYSVFLKDGDRFLMTSKKRSNNKTSNYLIR